MFVLLDVDFVAREYTSRMENWKKASKEFGEMFNNHYNHWIFAHSGAMQSQLRKKNLTLGHLSQESVEAGNKMHRHAYYHCTSHGGGRVRLCPVQHTF